MEPLIHWLRDAPLWQVVVVLLAENLLIFGLALLLGHLLVRRYGARRVSLPAPPLHRLEVAVAGSNVLMNTVVTLVGLFLWRAGFVRFRTDTGAWAVLDVFVLLLMMDFAMYWLHRTAHHRLLFPILHRLHHAFDRPRPLTLFVLNPVENVAFGTLWLVVITLYPASWAGMSVYLALNVLFGTIGHLGVEPLPDAWARVPGLRNVAGSTFHARHHQHLATNFGFYTLFWDRLFGTLGADYWDRFGRLPDALAPSECVHVAANGRRQPAGESATPTPHL